MIICRPLQHQNVDHDAANTQNASGLFAINILEFRFQMGLNFLREDLLFRRLIIRKTGKVLNLNLASLLSNKHE